MSGVEGLSTSGVEGLGTNEVEGLRTNESKGLAPAMTTQGHSGVTQGVCCRTKSTTVESAGKLSSWQGTVRVTSSSRPSVKSRPAAL